MQSKFITTQVAAVMVVAIAGWVGMVLGLAIFANWSDGAIVAMSTGFGAILVNSVISIGNQARNRQVLESTAQKVETIVHQTNAMASDERQDIANRAVAVALDRRDS